MLEQRWLALERPRCVELGQNSARYSARTLLVEKWPGGEGAAAMALVTNKPADGNYILSTTSSMSFVMSTKDINFTPADFICPCRRCNPRPALPVRADSSGFKTMKEFMDFIHDHPDQVSVGGFSSPGFHQFVFY